MGNIITALKNISINEELGKGEKLGESAFITNDKDRINSMVTAQFEKLAGILESQNLRDAHAVIYKKPLKITDKNTALNQLNLFLGEVQLFQTCLWLVKDNSVNNEFGFHISTTDRKFEVSSNYLSTLQSTCAGKNEVTEFTRSELREARIRFRSMNNIIPLGISFAAKKHKFNRIERSLLYVQIARSNSDLSLKTSEYCSAFEAILSTSPTEIAHQLSERVGKLIGKNAKEQIEIYREMKKAYNIRSKIVHGDELKDNQIEQLPAIVSNLDDYLRRTLLLVFSDSHANIFKGNNQQLDEFFIERLFNTSNN